MSRSVSERQRELARLPETQRIPFWHDPSKRALIYQALALGLVFVLGYYLFAITQANLRRQSIATGFSFIEREAGFEIGEPLISYSSADTYARALLVGVLNTLKVSLTGMILTLILGTLVGIARLSSNWLLARLAGAYIEVLQNIPVLLQLYFWYSVFHDSLPGPRQSLNPVPGFFLNNRGFYFPLPLAHPAYLRMGIALVVAGLLISYSAPLGATAPGSDRSNLSHMVGGQRAGHRPSGACLASVRGSHRYGCPQVDRLQLRRRTLGQS